MLRTLLIKAGESDRLRRIVSGWRPTRAVVAKFVAGESLEDGLAAVRTVAQTQRTATLDYLGEAVTEAGAAKAAAGVYHEALERIGAEGLDCGISVKPTQMGLLLDPQLARDLLAALCADAARAGVHVTLDMEDHEVTDATIELVEELRAGRPDLDVGCAVQAYLHRTRADVERLSKAGASLRLCKGAYAEPDGIAYQGREAIRESYLTSAAYLLRHGTYPRFATHDDVLITRVRDDARRAGVPIDSWELQMLYGVRPSLQRQLAAEGLRMRVYIPFGEQWYPYFMRRLAERPANLAFFLRALRDT